MIAAMRASGSHAFRTPSVCAYGLALIVLAWAASGLSPARAQTNGVPNEKTLEEALRKQPLPTKHSPNPAAAKKAGGPAGASPERPKPARHGTLIPMVVVSDVACALEVNGDSIAVLEPGAVKKLSVWPGDQLVKCASTEEPGEIYSVVQSIRAGEQSVLQILLAPRVDAARQKRAAQPQTLSAEDDKGLPEESARRAEEVKQLPARPILPFSIDEHAWATLENSAFYRDLPRRTHKITVQVSSKVLGEPSKESSANRTQATTREISPMGDKCVLLHSVTRKSEPVDAPADVTEDYRCGLLKLETVSNGKLVAAVSASDVESFLESDKTLREKPPCEIPSSGPASAFHAALTGTATRHGCSSGDYYFEDLNVWLYELGEMDPQKQQYVVPSTGYHFESVADGDGGRITTTYEAFSWTDDNLMRGDASRN